jgi:hypothetical protein
MIPVLIFLRFQLVKNQPGAVLEAPVISNYTPILFPILKTLSENIMLAGWYIYVYIYMYVQQNKTYHIITSHCNISHHITLQNSSHHITLNHIKLHHITSHHIT